MRERSTVTMHEPEARFINGSIFRRLNVDGTPVEYPEYILARWTLGEARTTGLEWGSHGNRVWSRRNWIDTHSPKLQFTMYS